MVKWFCFVFLFGAFAQAGPAKMEVMLKWQTAVGVRDQQSLRLKDGKYYLNSKSLDNSSLAQMLKPIHFLSTPESSRAENCAAGFYTLKVSKKASIREEKGCLDTKRFSSLTESFDLLRRYAP